MDPTRGIAKQVIEVAAQKRVRLLKVLAAHLRGHGAPAGAGPKVGRVPAMAVPEVVWFAAAQGFRVGRWEALPRPPAGNFSATRRHAR